MEQPHDIIAQWNPDPRMRAIFARLHNRQGSATQKPSRAMRKMVARHERSLSLVRERQALYRAKRHPFPLDPTKPAHLEHPETREQLPARYVKARLDTFARDKKPAEDALALSDAELAHVVKHMERGGMSPEQIGPLHELQRETLELEGDAQRAHLLVQHPELRRSIDVQSGFQDEWRWGSRFTAGALTMQDAMSHHTGIALGPHIARDVNHELGDGESWTHDMRTVHRLLPVLHADVQAFYHEHPELTKTINGVPHVTLYRGMRFYEKGRQDNRQTGLSRDATPVPDAFRAVTGHHRPESTTWTDIHVTDAPLSSWSNSFHEAHTFASDMAVSKEGGWAARAKPKGRGYVLAAHVPVTRLMGNGIVSLGEPSQGEHVVIGGPLHVAATQVS